MKGIFVYIAIFCLGFSATAQSVNNKRIKGFESTQLQDQEMFNSINKANSLVNEEPKKALDEVENALKLSYKNSNERGEAYSYQTLGAIHYRQKEYNQSVSYYKKALKLFEKNSDQKGKYTALKHLGIAQESNGQLSDAIATYKAFLPLSIKAGNQADELSTKEALGRTLFNNGSFAEANRYYKQLLSYYRSVDIPDKIPTTYEHIGKCYAGSKDTTQAMKYFNLASGIADANSSEDDQVNSWQNVSRSYNSVGKYDKSVEYEKKALKVNKKRGNKVEVMANNSNIAKDYLVMNRADEAIPFLEDNLNLSQEIGELKSSGETYKTLSDAYFKMGKIDDAKVSFEKYRALQESVLAEREEELAMKEALNSGLFEKEKQIELLVKDRELDEVKIKLLEEERALRAKAMSDQRRLNYILAGVLALLVIGLIILYRSVRQKKIANKLLSIRSLRSQMNPHFIFNSLNSVNSFISKSDDRSANKYLTEFARLMRTVLDHSRQDFVSLRDEIEVLERYLNLEHIRFSEHFDFELEVDDDLELEKLLIPPMLVQPYIENSIWHGLRYLENKGKLRVSFTAEDNRMKVRIEDNGIGRQKSKEIKTRNQKEGSSTGISNTETRLRLLNEVHHLNLSASISDAFEDGSGTIVELALPYIDVDDKRYAEVQ